jgi:hypothetical protein
MAKLYGRDWEWDELKRRVGDASQLGGVRRMTIADGPGKGVECAEFDTGAGLAFTVAIDRCLDIPRASYKGVPLCWHSMTGVKHPGLFEAMGTRFLYHFFGGLLTTCGLTSMGAPSKDSGEEYPLHGRASGIPAEGATVWNRWNDNELEMGVSGSMREAALFGPHLRLSRKITALLGENKIRLHDITENAGFEPAPFQILYHINYGFPLLDETSILEIPNTKVTPRDAEAEKDADKWDRFAPPQPGYAEQCFFHEVPADGDGWAACTLCNPALMNGSGLTVHQRWTAATLPCLTEWKQIGEGAYTLGLEPGNGLPLGRAEEQAHGRLQMLGPGEKVEMKVEWEVIEG